MGIMEAIKKLDNLVDESDPDVSCTCIALGRYYVCRYLEI